jgi:hypothetical protein
MDSETLHAQLIDLLATFDDLAQQAAEKARDDALPVMQRAYFTGCMYSMKMPGIDWRRLWRAIWRWPGRKHS